MQRLCFAGAERKIPIKCLKYDLIPLGKYNQRRWQEEEVIIWANVNS